MYVATPAIYRKVSRRLLPILLACYLINYIDRVNVSFAELTMAPSLGLSAAAYGLGAGLFFLGYFLFEVPSNLCLYRFGARRWIARIVFSWGFISSATAFVKADWHLYLIRFLLGAAEAGFFPGIILYLTWWYPATLRARIVAQFLAAVPVAGIIGGPLSGWIMHYFDGALRLQGWQWLFLLEGLPCFAAGWWVLAALPDRPSEARWLTEAERVAINRELEADESARAEAGAPHRAWAAFGRAAVWKLCAIYFCGAMGLYGLTFWLPQIIRQLGWNDPLSIGFVSAVPWFFAVGAMIIFGAVADRLRRWRLVAAVAACVATIGFVCCAVAENRWLDLAGVSVAAAGVMTMLAVQWALPAGLLNGAAAAAGIALVNSFGNLGGFVSPTLIGWIVKQSGDHHAPQLVTALFVLSGGVLLFAFRSLQPGWQVSRGPVRSIGQEMSEHPRE